MIKLVVVCLLGALIFGGQLSFAQEKLKALRSWTPLATKEPIDFPILKIGKKSKWTIQVRASSEERIVTVYKTDTVLVNGVREIRRSASSYDVNGGALPFRKVLQKIGLSRFPPLDSGRVVVEEAVNDSGLVTHWIFIDGASHLVWLGPIVKIGKYISCEIVLTSLNQNLDLKAAAIQTMGAGVLFMKDSELKILSASGTQLAVDKIGQVIQNFNRQMLPIVIGRDTNWIVWLDRVPNNFGHFVRDLKVPDSSSSVDSVLAAKIYFDGRHLRALWPDSNYLSYDMGSGKHQLDLIKKKIGKASVMTISDFGNQKAVLWFDQKNQIITAPSDSIYNFKLSDAYLYSARRQPLLGLIDTNGAFHELPISGYGELRDARMTDLKSIADEADDELTELEIERSEDLAILEYEREDGRTDSAFVWPDKKKMTPYWGRPVYAMDSTYLFRTIVGTAEVLRPAEDFDRIATRYHVIDDPRVDSNIKQFKPIVIGNQSVVKLGFKNKDTVSGAANGADWLWVQSGRITVDLGTFVGYAEMSGYPDSSVLVFIDNGMITILSTARDKWWRKSFYVDDMPLKRSELIVTVWNRFMAGEERVYARIVLDTKKPDGSNAYDQTKILPMVTR